MLVCWCECVHVCTRAHGGQRCQIPLAVVSCLVWVLGLELQPSGRGAAQAFILQTSSPALILIFLVGII